MDVFSPLRLGDLDLPNRIAMAPMTRARSNDDAGPNALVAEYYAQRATAGLLISEATSVSRLSVSRPYTSAIHHEGHAKDWKGVTDKVHAAGGRIFQQLYHMGRKADITRLPQGERPVAPSAIKSTPQIGGANTYFEFAEPRALSTEEVPQVVAEFERGAALAKKAGMDGVEIHGANGYLIDQFLKSSTNMRTDRYGGSVANRVRFLLEITEAAIGVFGAGRVGVRVNPHYIDGGINDSDPEALFSHVAAELDRLKIAYFHLIEANISGTRQAPPAGAKRLLPIIRKLFKGSLMINATFTRETADQVIAAGEADLVSFGELFISNPDLVERFRTGAKLNKADRAKFYVGGPSGYTDYPTLGIEKAAAKAS